MTPEQIEQAARIVCEKRGWNNPVNPISGKPIRLLGVMNELTAFMQLAEACDEVLTEEAVPA